MSDFDRSAPPRYGARVARAGTAQIDQGLRSYILGVTGLAALAINALSTTSNPDLAAAQLGHVMLTSFGAALYTSPLRWVVMLAPLAFIIFFQIRIDRMSAA